MLFFHRFFFHGFLPIPSDTIVGLYHPYRDVLEKEYPRGLPFKNPLITDPIRQQYPWRNLSIESLKQLTLPLWNPYSMAGVPLLANFQSGVFYPLNILFFLFPFSFAWALLILLQPILASIFLYFYLRKMKLTSVASAFGAITFAFCGFSISWLEWGTIMQVALWLPLVLLAKENLLKKITWQWVILIIFAEVAQFFAGHLQTLFYSLLISSTYLLVRLAQRIHEKYGKKKFIYHYIKSLAPFVCIGLCLLVITAMQWIPTLQFIGLSNRFIDQNDYTKPGWFIPVAHLVQLLAPDFFGNPATGNYWGTWNYGELVSYVGIVSLTMAVYAMLFRRDKKTLFFGLLGFLALLFSLDNPIARIPYVLHIPFLSSAQPTRLIFVLDFSLAVLAGLGLDYYLHKKNNIKYPLLLMSIGYIFLWGFSFWGKQFASISIENLLVAKHNLILPTAFFLFSVVGFLLYSFYKKKFSFSSGFIFSIAYVH